MKDNDDDDDDIDNDDDDNDNDDDDFFEFKPLNTSKRALNTNTLFFGTPCMYLLYLIHILHLMYFLHLLSLLCLLYLWCLLYQIVKLKPRPGHYTGHIVFKVIL